VDVKHIILIHFLSLRDHFSGEMCTYFSQLEMNDGKGTGYKISQRTRNVLPPFFSVSLEFVGGNCGWLNSNLLMLLICQRQGKLCPMMKSTDMSCTLESEPLVKQQLLESEQYKI